MPDIPTTAELDRRLDRIQTSLDQITAKLTEQAAYNGADRERFKAIERRLEVLESDHVANRRLIVAALCGLLADAVFAIIT